MDYNKIINEIIEDSEKLLTTKYTDNSQIYDGSIIPESWYIPPRNYVDGVMFAAWEARITRALLAGLFHSVNSGFPDLVFWKATFLIS